MKSWQVLGRRVSNRRQDEYTAGRVSQVLNSFLYLYPASMVSTPPEAFLSDDEYRSVVNKLVRAGAEQGDVVIVGRASQVILAGLRDVLHVRILAPFEKRVAYVMQREGLDQHAAESRIHLKDHDRARHLEMEYHQKVEDGHLYDLVLNTSLLDLESAVRSTAIAFELSEACVGQLWTTEITVQVTDAVTYDTVVSGTFLQVLVTGDSLPERAAPGYLPIPTVTVKVNRAGYPGTQYFPDA